MRRFALFSLSATLCLSMPGLVLAQPPDPDARPLFDRLDQNKDGAISDDEIPAERKNFFARLLREGDKNEDGKLSREEFQAAAQQGRRRQNAENDAPRRPDQGQANFDVAPFFRNLDKNSDGKVTPDEVPEERRERFQAGLARTDKDGDGGLNLEEFRASMAAMAGRRPEAGTPQPSNAPARPNIANAPFFRAIDSDRDGKLSGDELAKAGEALKTLDKNGDGALTPEELVPAGAPGPRPDQPQAGRPPQEEARSAAFLQRLKQADTNGDGTLSKEEAPEQMKENFDRIDANGDGQLDTEELRRMIARFGRNRADNPPNRPRDRTGDNDNR